MENRELSYWHMHNTEYGRIVTGLERTKLDARHLTLRHGIFFHVRCA